MLNNSWVYFTQASTNSEDYPIYCEVRDPKHCWNTANYKQIDEHKDQHFLCEIHYKKIEGNNNG